MKKAVNVLGGYWIIIYYNYYEHTFTLLKLIVVMFAFEEEPFLPVFYICIQEVFFL